MIFGGKVALFNCCQSKMHYSCYDLALCVPNNSLTWEMMFEHVFWPRGVL